MAPALLTTTSKLASSKTYTCASACTKPTLLRPAAAARARPFASIAEDRSIPTTRPGSTAAPACRVNAPLPHPRSSTSSPGVSAAARSRTARCSVLARSKPSASSDHCAPSGPSQACRIASFAEPATMANPSHSRDLDRTPRAGAAWLPWLCVCRDPGVVHDAGFGSHGPGVVSRLQDDDVAGTHRRLGAVVGADGHLTGDDDARVPDLAGVSTGDRLHVLRPSPAWLEGAA